MGSNQLSTLHYDRISRRFEVFFTMLPLEARKMFGDQVLIYILYIFSQHRNGEIITQANSPSKSSGCQPSVHLLGTRRV